MLCTKIWRGTVVAAKVISVPCGNEDGVIKEIEMCRYAIREHTMALFVVRLQQLFEYTLYYEHGQCDTGIGQEALITTSSALYYLASQYTACTQAVHS